MMLWGFDISNWQNGLNAGNLDCAFVIMKATEGTFFVDPLCDIFVQQVKQAGKLWGFYHFARENSPEAEAEFFHNETRGYDHQGVPVLDYEVWNLNYDDVEWCERFMTRYHELTGVWPMLYISASHCSQFRNSWIPQKCGLWVAGYPDIMPPDFSCPYDVSPWEFAAIWQYTSSEVRQGHSLDANIAYMDDAAWFKYAGAELPNSEPVKEKKTITGRVTIELD